MTMKPNAASVTATPCTCGFLRQQVSKDGSPFVYSERMGEYGVRADTAGGYAVHRLYHCPFCGGALPLSKRGDLHEDVTAEEFHRLVSLVATLRDLDEAMSTFGPPEIDTLVDPSAEPLRSIPVRHPPRRTLLYRNLSQTADVRLFVREGAARVAIEVDAKPRRPATE